MNKRDKILREILSDERVAEKYGLKKDEINNLTATPASQYPNKIVEVMATILKAKDNGRSSRQIYSVLKNIHKI